MIGTKLGPYRITEAIGEGGMATVYRAYQESMDRHVAIKVIRGNILHDPTLRDRFRREARLIARLEHPHLLPVYDFDGDHDPPYIVMRYLEGGTLKQVMQKGALPHGETIYMLRQVAQALDYAHRQGVVHRDLKPSNVMIDREGNAFVTDFGIARAADQEDLTGTGILIGTPGYMSPEQAQGAADVDHLSDVYSLGALVYEVLTGAQPFEGDSHLAVIMAHVNEELPSARVRVPDLPEAIDDVFRRAMAKNRAERYENADAFVNELAAVLRATPAKAPAALQSVTQTLSVDQLKAFADQQEKKKESRTPSQATPTDQQRQMTTVYVDATELAELLYEQGKDAETVRTVMDKVWKRFTTLARERGGVIQSRTDELAVALWGRDRASEDDPEQALRCALRMRDTVREEAERFLGKDWEPNEESPNPFAAGVTTGPVLLERSGDTGSFTASGSAITLAGRLKDAAEPGEILVAHDTFTQVRGVFTFHPHDPVRVRGRKERLEVYVVEAAKPRAFRRKARGIEGVETRMIGREIELRLLQEALTLTLEDGETQVVTVVGEAGVGKSRLLYEFSDFVDLQDETVWLFEARATQPSMVQPYSLTRDLFSFRFQILDSDSLETVHEKFVKGAVGFLGEGKEEDAELMGQLVGFDFSERPAVKAALKDAEDFRRRALGVLGSLFEKASAAHPVTIHIEDIHWADDRSLDLINNLVRENTNLPMFVICMARPSLYERRPQWGEGQRFHERIQLEPLSQLSSRRLVKELLKKMKEIPAGLRDLIVDRADGNPFYIEELVKALIDDKVILKGETEWTVDETRLSAVRVPPTLTGVLQSRLDTLPPALGQLLQRASVVGRIFWDAAVVKLSEESGLDEGDVVDMLEELREREMILRREESAFAGTTEYVFRHAILRDVTYETVVPRQRRAIHKAVAEWLLEIGGERASEQTVLVAEHFSLAGEVVKAAEQLRKAGEAAAAVAAYDEAMTTLQRARTMLKGDEHVAERLLVDIEIAEIYSRRGLLPESTALLEPLVEVAREADAKLALSQILGQLGRIALWKDDLEAAHRYLDEALPLTEEVGDEVAQMFLLRQMGNMYFSEPEKALPYFQKSTDLARKLGKTSDEASATNGMAIIAHNEEKLDEAIVLYEKAIALARPIGDKTTLSMVLGNMAEVYRDRKDFDQARKLAGEALSLARETGDRGHVFTGVFLHATLDLDEGRDEEAFTRLQESFRLSRDMEYHSPDLLIAFARHQARMGQHARGLEWVGHVKNMDSWQSMIQEKEIGRRWKELVGDLPQEEIDAALERGAARSMKDLYSEIEGLCA